MKKYMKGNKRSVIGSGPFSLCCTKRLKIVQVENAEVKGARPQRPDLLARPGQTMMTAPNGLNNGNFRWITRRTQKNPVWSAYDPIHSYILWISGFLMLIQGRMPKDGGSGKFHSWPCTNRKYRRRIQIDSCLLPLSTYFECILLLLFIINIDFA